MSPSFALPIWLLMAIALVAAVLTVLTMALLCGARDFRQVAELHGRLGLGRAKPRRQTNPPDPPVHGVFPER